MMRQAVLPAAAALFLLSPLQDGYSSDVGIKKTADSDADPSNGTVWTLPVSAEGYIQLDASIPIDTLSLSMETSAAEAHRLRRVGAGVMACGGFSAIAAACAIATYFPQGSELASLLGSGSLIVAGLSGYYAIVSSQKGR